MTKTINELTDAELAAMVRNSIYAKHARFGDGPMDARFLLVLAVPYGKDESVESLPDALDAFHRLVSDYDWKERDLQVYDHSTEKFFSTTTEEAEQALFEEE